MSSPFQSKINSHCLRLAKQVAILGFIFFSQNSALAQKRYTAADSLNWERQLEITDSLIDEMNYDTVLTAPRMAVTRTIHMASEIFGNNSVPYLKGLMRLYAFQILANDAGNQQNVLKKINRLSKQVLRPWDPEYLELKGWDVEIFKSIDEKIAIYKDLVNAAEKYHPDELFDQAKPLAEQYLAVDDVQKADSIINKFEKKHNAADERNLLILKSESLQKKGQINAAITILEALLKKENLGTEGEIDKYSSRILEPIFEQLAELYFKNNDYAAANYYFQKYLEVTAARYDRIEILQKQLEWSELFEACNQHEYYRSLCDEYAAASGNNLFSGNGQYLQFYVNYYRMKGDDRTADSLQSVVTNLAIKLMQSYPEALKQPEFAYQYWAAFDNYVESGKELKKVLKKTRQKYSTISFEYLYWQEKLVNLDENENKYDTAIRDASFALELSRKLFKGETSLPELKWLHKLGHFYWRKDTAIAYQYILKCLSGYEKIGTSIDSYDFKLIAIDAVELALSLNDSANFYKYACLLMENWKDKFKSNVVKFDESQQEKIINDNSIGLPALHLKSLMVGFKKWFQKDSAFLAKSLKAFTTIYGSSLESELQLKGFLKDWHPSQTDSFKIIDRYQTLLALKDSLRYDSMITPSTFNENYYDADFIHSVLKQMASNRSNQSVILQYHIAAVKSQLMSFMSNQDLSVWYRVPYTKLHWVYYPDDADSLRLGLFIVKNFNRDVEFIDICAYRQLDSVARRYYNGANTRGIIIGKDSTSEDINRQLYHLLWSKVSSRIDTAETIYSFPSGLMNVISLNALQDSTGIYNIEKYKLHQLSSQFDFINTGGDLDRDDTELVLVGAVNYGEGSVHYDPDPGQRTLPPKPFEYLGGTSKEIDTIQSICKSLGLNIYKLRGDSITESKFNQFPTKGSSKAILHIATHGFYLPPLKQHESIFDNPDPPLQRTGFVLSGVNRNLDRKLSDTGTGIVTAEKIYQRKNLNKVDLVVLSACETALGDIHSTQGVFGLARAFRLAGVPRLIVSLWPVPDTETSELMSLFYSNLANDTNYYSAFIKAQREMQKRYADPAKWAGFIFIGQ